MERSAWCEASRCYWQIDHSFVAGTTKRSCSDSVLLRHEPANMALGIELKANALDQVELGLEQVDVVFLVLHQFLEQVA